MEARKVIGRPFQKGQSGNPTGRRNHKEIDALAREHCPEAIARVVQIMRSSRSGREVIAAAQLLLERGYGKPVQAVALSGDGEGGPIPLQGLGPIYGIQPSAET